VLLSFLTFRPKKVIKGDVILQDFVIEGVSFAYKLVQLEVYVKPWTLTKAVDAKTSGKKSGDVQQGHQPSLQIILWPFASIVHKLFVVQWWKFFISLFTLLEAMRHCKQIWTRLQTHP